VTVTLAPCPFEPNSSLEPQLYPTEDHPAQNDTVKDLKQKVVGTYLSSGMAWDKSCHCGISVVKGSLYEACRLRADGCNKDGMRTMGQAAVSCTDRKPPGSCRGAPSDSITSLFRALEVTVLNRTIHHTQHTPSPRSCTFRLQTSSESTCTGSFCCHSGWYSGESAGLDARESPTKAVKSAREGRSRKGPEVSKERKATRGAAGLVGGMDS
jgi:hypothetical protein